MIDGYSNKHRIGKKPPSTYIGKFAKTNKSIAKTLQTHLIGDMELYGVTDDDYETFISRRAKTIANALNVKLMSMTSVEAAAAETKA